MRFTTITTNKQILFKSIKEHQKQPGLAGPGFWRKDKYTERSPTFAFTRSLGSFVVFGGLEIRGQAESHRWAGYQAAKTYEAEV